MTQTILIVAISYILGAIPVAYIVARMNSVNIFEVGSGNMGTTNVIRAVGPTMGILVLLLDVLKGFLAIYIGRRLMPASIHSATVISALGAIIGHNWSVFAFMVTGKLRGGKGAATALGTFIVISPVYLTIIAIVVGATVIIRTRYMSLGVLCMLSVAAPTLILMSLLPAGPLQPIYAVYTTGLTLLILYRFRENIQRLLAGKERRVGESA